MFCKRYVYYTITSYDNFITLLYQAIIIDFLKWILEMKKTIGEDYLHPLYCVLHMAKICLISY